MTGLAIVIAALRFKTGLECKFPSGDMTIGLNIP